MDANSEKYRKYVSILKEELVTAIGCTEPIAIAFAAAKAKEVLGVFPERALIECSGNIIKNAMGAVVPNSGGLKGIQASVLAGITGGSADRELEVLSSITREDVDKISSLVETEFCTVKQLESDAVLHIIVRLYAGENMATTEIKYAHTNIFRITRNKDTIYENITDPSRYSGAVTDRSILNVGDIVDFADTAPIEDVKELLQRQIDYNMAIAKEGMRGEYGVGIGKTLLKGMGASLWTRVKAYAAAASEARMGGSVMPVVTNSGSGNQGITASVPVIVYAAESGIEEEKLLRGLIMSNLLTIHQKTKIGKLSAFCGAVCAACAAGAAITYLAGGRLEEISRTIVNTLANVPGIICDGAKPSCAAKIASSLDATLMAHLISVEGKSYEPGTGILKEDIEQTISMVGNMANKGMAATDTEILRIMLN